MNNKFLSSLFCIATFFTANAQSPNAINYQAVARNNSGTVLANQAISLQISFLDLSPLGTVVYSERHNVSTNALGLFTLQIGAGSVQSGDFTNINWGKGTKFIKIEMDATGGTNYTNLGTTQIISVPYSLYSNVAGLANGLIGSATIAPSQITNGGATNNQILQWNGTAWIPATISTNQNNTDATLKGNGSTGNPFGIAQQGATSGQVIKWNGSAWMPADESNSDWKITGNSGLTDGTNFIGTTTNVALNFRINNQKAGRVDSANSSTFWGYGSGKNNTGNQNSFSGYKAGNLNTTGNNNSAFGTSSLQNNSTGSNNTAFGDSSLFSNTVGSNSIAIGKGALKSATHSTYPYSPNIAIGAKALYSYNSSSGYNVAIGESALQNSTSGFYNIASGYRALYLNTTGFRNIASGYQTLYSNIDGYCNVAIGSDALFNNRNGNYNVALGYQALVNNRSGISNTAYGYNSLYGDTSGNYNTCLGNGAGFYIKSGNYNTRIGVSAASSTEMTWDNSGMFGYNPINPGGSNIFRMGNSSITGIGGQVGWTTVSDARIKELVKENIPGLDFINRLRPVSYQYNITKENRIMDPLKPDTAIWEGKYDIEKMRYSGFLAQEVDSIAKSIGYDFSGVDRPKTLGGLYGLRYAEFVVPLVKAVQEQQKTLEEQKAMIDALMKRIEELEKK